MNKQYRMQLISPIVGEKIYHSNSFKKGIQKCYDEFKSCNSDFKEFYVMDILTQQTFKFAVNGKNNKKNTEFPELGHSKNLMNTANKNCSKTSNLGINNLDISENILDNNDPDKLNNNSSINEKMGMKLLNLENNVKDLKKQIKVLESKMHFSHKIENESNSNCTIM